MKKDAKDIKKLVKEGYGKVATQGTSCCPSSSCCGSVNKAQDISKAVGYSDKEMNTVPEGANLGLGCGNPVALASLKEGEVVLDLGSGAGFDAFLAAQRVGERGRVIGVDMTPEMLEKARLNARKGNYKNVEFRQGEIEKLPVEDDSVDAIISNCVINLSLDKENVFKEAFRVLKLGGRLMVSDLVLVKDLPDVLKESVEAYVGCFAGAIMKDDYLKFITMAGFQDVKVMNQSNYPVDAMFENLEPAKDVVVSIKVLAVKKERQKMKIEILGVGCPKCKQLAENVQAALKECSVCAEVSKVTDIDKIVECGVLATPALVVDGKVFSSGKLLTKDEIKKLLVR